MKILKRILVCGSIFGLMLLFFIINHVEENFLWHWLRLHGIFFDYSDAKGDKDWMLAIFGVFSATLVGWLLGREIIFLRSDSLKPVCMMLCFFPHMLYLIKALVSWNVLCIYPLSDRIEFLIPPLPVYAFFNIWLTPLHYYMLCLFTSVIFFAKRGGSGSRKLSN